MDNVKNAIKKGIIDVSNLNIPPEKHELKTAQFFAQLGKDITFIRPHNVKGSHTPDFVMDKIPWEIKYKKNLHCVERLKIY